MKAGNEARCGSAESRGGVRRTLSGWTARDHGFGGAGDGMGQARRGKLIERGSPPTLLGGECWRSARPECERRAAAKCANSQSRRQERATYTTRRAGVAALKLGRRRRWDEQSLVVVPTAAPNCLWQAKVSEKCFSTRKVSNEV